MIILDTDQNGIPLDTSYFDLWNESHKFYNSSISKVILFDDFAEYRSYFGLDNPPTPMPQFTWDIPSNATVVEHKEYGLPLDDKWLSYPRFFRGDVLFVFNTIEEFDQYISDRTDKTDYGDQ